MASLACGVGVAIGGGVALVLALPAYALKVSKGEIAREHEPDLSLKPTTLTNSHNFFQEILEVRMKKNMKMHLGRRTKCSKFDRAFLGLRL